MVIHKFYYDGWLLVSEESASCGNITTNFYVWGLDLSGSLQGAGGVGGLLAARLGTNNVVCLYDGNRNVSELIDASTGGVKAHYEYSPFGETLVSEGALAKDNPFRFSTKFMDDETALVYYGYRFYSLGKGMSPSRDPLQELGGANLYGFLRNNAINTVDPVGMLSWSDLENAYNAAKAKLDAAEQCMNTVREAFKRRDQGYTDKLNHCLSSCQISEDCGQKISDALGTLKEVRDLSLGGIEWLLAGVIPKSWEGWVHDYIQGGSFHDSVGDFAANFRGFGCKNDPAGCECCCKTTYK